MIVVNLFAGPGSRKSTGAAYIFSKLKMAGVNAELVTEFAKDKVWEESVEVFKNQVYIFGKQSFRMSRLKDKVDVVITDSPLLLCTYYNNDESIASQLDALVFRVVKGYNNLNYFIRRKKEYNPNGRFQTEEEANKIDDELHYFLDDNDVWYEEVDGTQEGYDTIVDTVLHNLHKLNNGGE